MSDSYARVVTRYGQWELETSCTRDQVGTLLTDGLRTLEQVAHTEGLQRPFYLGTEDFLIAVEATYRETLFAKLYPTLYVYITVPLYSSTVTIRVSENDG